MASAAQFTRMARLYGLVERQRSAELRLAAQSEQEAAAAHAQESAAWREDRARSRAAVLCGDKAERLVAELSMELRTTQVTHLAALQSARAAVREQAWQAHRQSQLESDQMRRVAERLRSEAAKEADRSAQAQADDRFGSRREWLRSRKRPA